MTDFATLVLAADTRQMTQAEKAIDGVTKSGERAETQTNNTSRAIENMDRLARRAAIGAGALVAATVALTRSSMNNIDELTKQARQVGLLTRDFQAMSLVAEEAGVSTGNLTNMIGLMQRNIVELQKGTASQTQTFNQLGISLSDLQGLSPDQQFERIAVALSGVEDPAQRTALSMEVFGRSGRAAINMLDGYTDALEDARRFQEAFGIAVGQDAAEAIERANDATGRLSMGFRGLGNVLAAEAAPRIEAFANSMIDLIIQTDAINRSAEILTNGITAVGVIAATVAASQLPAFTAAVIAKTVALTAGATAAGVLTTALGVLRGAVMVLGGPWAILAGLIGGAAAAMLLFKDNTEVANPVMDDAKAAIDGINAVLAVSSEVALPAAARETLNLTNENIKLAKSAYEAARAELTKAQAASQAAQQQLAVEQAFLQIEQERLPGFVAMEKQAKKVQDALRDLNKAEADLTKRINEGQISLSKANDEFDTARQRSIDLSVSLDDVSGAASGAAGAMGSGGAAGAALELNEQLEQTPPIVNDVANAFADFVMRGFRDFQGFVRSVVSSFRNMLRDMIAMAARNRIMVSLGMTGAGSAASAAGMAGIGGAGGIMSSVVGSFGTGAGMAGLAGGTGFLGGVGSVASGLATGGLAGAGTAISTAMAGATTSLAGFAAAAGAIALPVAAAVAVFSFFRTKTKELDQGLKVTVDNMDTLVQSFRTVERSRFWGLSKRVSTTMDQASDDIANPIIDAVSGMQRAAISAAETLGVGADAFDGFSHEINISLRKLNEQQAMQRVSEELGKMGDAFASLVPGVESMNELLGVAQQRYDLTTRLLQLQGDEEELLRRHREQEVNAVHELNSELLLHIHSLEDAAIAAERAAEEAQNRIFLEAQIARERESIERRMLELQGDTAAIRERELEALDPANRALAENVFALEDHARAVEEASRAAEEAAKKDQAIQSEMQRLQARILQLQGDTNALRERELAGLSPANRALQEMIFALEDSAKAAEEASRAAEEAARTDRAIADEMQRLQTRILQLQGDTNALREREIAALHPTNIALQRMIFSLEDAAEAAEAAARAADELAREQQAIAQQRFNLESRILQLQGDTTALRQRELDAIDPANRALQEMIFSLEDAATAAEQAARAADELAQQQRAISQEQFGLETRLLQLQGDTVALRARELDALDPTNRSLQQLIFSLQDAASAAEEAARAADELASKQRAIAQERFGLESRLLQVQGNTAALRERELDALDPSNRQILENIFAVEDAQRRAEEAQRKAEERARIAQQKAEERAREQERIAQERFGLETKILQLQGNTNALRQRELDALTPVNRALQQMIFSLEDAARVADERFGLETKILQLQGKTTELRERELEALDPSNRSLQKFIFGLEDAKTALDAITASDFATGVEFDRARALARIAVEQSVPSFAGGGFHGGGLRLVGESGPELEVTGASRIYNNGDTINMLSNAPVVSELQQLRREIVSMRDEQRQLGIQTARNTDRSYRVLREWNVTGLPEERVA
jgi:hypothetical protein